jgi:hypothetical protein
MKFEVVFQAVRSIPFISHGNARILYDIIVKQRMSNVLELGIGHGTATCYIAAALDELGRGAGYLS